MDEQSITNTGYRIALGPDQKVIKGIFCQHGPTLLFEKLNETKEVTSKFYACSACRDRKICSFHIDFDKKLSPASLEARQEIYSQHSALDKQIKYVPYEENSELKACTRCGIINTTDNSCQDHHPELQLLTPDQYQKPSQWIPALKTNEANAQFFFKPDVLKLVGEFLLASKRYDHVVCIGVPTLHEYISRHPPLQGISSLLLDIDARMRQFHQKFFHYNLFNGHFFLDNEEEQFTKELDNASNVLIVIDPPYGGFLEPIRSSIESLRENFAQVEDMKMMLFFPYFMEPHVTKSLPNLRMSDFKVDYSNHRGYDGSRKVRGSPARIFTDISQPEFILPATQGYKYCKICQRYVHKNNKHCALCNACTTKDGPTYKHCKKCSRCVKLSWKHCDKCSKCSLPDHRCSADNTRGCQNCGKSEHNMKQCPSRPHEPPAERGKAKGGKAKRRPSRHALRQQEKSGAIEECKRTYTGPRTKGNPIWKNSYDK